MLVKLEETVLQWAQDFPLHQVQRQDVGDISSSDIDWRFMRIKHGRTEYFDEIRTPISKNHTLATVNLTNETEQVQTYFLNSERVTTSVSNISVSKALSICNVINLKMAPPNPVIEANAGFKEETSIENAQTETFEEKLVWSLKNKIAVPPQHRTKVELMLKEEEYSSNFSCKTRLSGMIHVALKHKKTNQPLRIISGRVQDIFKGDTEFVVDKTAVYFVSNGTIKCRFGKEQHVKISQLEIDSVDEANAGR